jgi:hypothetical protein
VKPAVTTTYPATEWSPLTMSNLLGASLAAAIFGVAYLAGDLRGRRAAYRLINAKHRIGEDRDLDRDDTGYEPRRTSDDEPALPESYFDEPADDDWDDEEAHPRDRFATLPAGVHLSLDPEWRTQFDALTAPSHLAAIYQRDEDETAPVFEQVRRALMESTAAYQMVRSDDGRPKPMPVPWPDPPKPSVLRKHKPSKAGTR